MPTPAHPPSDVWRMLTATQPGKPMPKGLDALWHMGTSTLNALRPRTGSFLRQAGKVLAIGQTFEHASDARLHEAIDDLRARFRCGRETHEDLLQALAVVREVAARQRGERHYRVQVAAALAMDAGCIAEMATGEGKTLAATLPAVIAGWRGRGCHVLTVNDYLAQRDADAMHPIYSFCGLRVDCVVGSTPPHARRDAYAADITYTTNKEVAADYLRDRLMLGRIRGLPATLLQQMVRGRGAAADRLLMRGLACAIVDEADSILIDEAVTPLIISGDAPNAQQVDAYREAARIAAELHAPEHFRIQVRYREVELTAAGRRRIAELTEHLAGLWRGARRREELVQQAITARELYQRGKQYVIQEGKIVIVDEFTGRLMPDRTWRDGLHQAVEAREELEIQPPKSTMARVSFQRFFRLYRKLSGMTGTATEAGRELARIYRTPVAVIPTNRPCIRRTSPDRIFADAAGKWAAIVAEIQAVHATGRPILVGTRSVAASEHLSNLLTEADMEHHVLNAVKHAEEAQIIVNAGHRDRITVATNMAGRGTDIKLEHGIAELGGLHVIATERHESRRIDRQLFGRAARQGDPGSAVLYASLEDELVQQYGGRAARWQRNRHRGRMTLLGRSARKLLDRAQARAQRLKFRQRMAVLKADDWLNEHLGFAGRE